MKFSGGVPVVNRTFLKIIFTDNDGAERHPAGHNSDVLQSNSALNNARFEKMKLWTEVI